METNNDYNNFLKLHFEKMKEWNERRAANEKKGLDKFYSLKKTFLNFKKLQHGNK